MKIRELREKRGFTKSELARAVGVKPSSEAQWENNEAMPSAAKLPQLAGILQCTIDELFRRPADESA